MFLMRKIPMIERVNMMSISAKCSLLVISFTLNKIAKDVGSADIGPSHTTTLRPAVGQVHLPVVARQGEGVAPGRDGEALDPQ
jgi:hypothetical protein